MALKAAIFDMDGLMLDTERVAKRAWLQAGQEHGYSITEQALTETIGVNKRGCKDVYYKHMGADFPFDTIHQRSRELMLEIMDAEGIDTKPGLTALFDYLEKQGIRKAVGTSTSQESAKHHLIKVGILPRFEALACGNEVENGKPAPDVFLLAAKRLGVSPSDCIVFEDSENGVRAAHAAEIPVIMVPDLKQPSEEVRALAFAVVNSLSEAIEEVKRFL